MTASCSSGSTSSDPDDEGTTIVSTLSNSLILEAAYYPRKLGTRNVMDKHPWNWSSGKDIPLTGGECTF